MLLEVVDDVGAHRAVEVRVGERHAGEVSGDDLHAPGQAGDAQVAFEQRAAASVDVPRVEAIERDDPSAPQHFHD